MFNKTFRKIKSLRSRHRGDERKELQSFLNDIDIIQKEIAEKKAIIKQEHEDGSRITNHRFTL